MKIVCLADNHLNMRLAIPPGDLLIHAGDFLHHGTFEETLEAAAWFKSLPHRWKVFIGGNHDGAFQKDREFIEAAFAGPGVTYLQDEAVTIEGLRLYGSPWHPWWPGCGAFWLQRGLPLKEKWDQIPEGLDILITHGPPAGIMDVTEGEHVGCEDLLQVVQRVKPRVHLFGHIHPGRGVLNGGPTTFINASIGNDSGDGFRAFVIDEDWHVQAQRI